jgi:DNA-binding transcriptional LysR family regulator
MELYQLRTFVTVAEERHLTRAAERLYTSQPSVSAHIKALEEEFGVQLFTRSRKGMRLTDAGSDLLKKAMTILDSSKELLSHAQKLTGEVFGKVRVGLNTDPNVLRVASFVRFMKGLHPRVRLQLTQSSSTRVLKYLRTGEFDCGFIMGKNRFPDITAVCLNRIEFLVVGPKEWEDRLKGASIEEISDFPWVIASDACPLAPVIDEMFGKPFQCFCKSVEADDETMKSLILAGTGVGLMYKNDALAAHKQGKVALWRGRPIQTNLSFVYLKREQDDPKIQAVLDGIRRTWKLSEHNAAAV